MLAQNVKYAAGESTWWAAINEYADWTDTEFASQKTSRSPILGNLKASGRALVEERANKPGTKRIDPWFRDLSWKKLTQSILVAYEDNWSMNTDTPLKDAASQTLQETLSC